ncbi:flavin reductase family protein [Agromyces laixinhei]|uniref:flavin reductase family protein n=1 Tax=Agromyces laixinhei TaxID=2585717 RepID=UPI0018DD23E5|nr:flavin reductase family protein [Agromyces laixinhei]
MTNQPASELGHLTIRPKMLYVGTPVFLVSTVNADGTFNLAPASSYWALEQMLVLGLETDGQSARNLLERPELTVSFPHPELWPAVERLASVTGRHPVPAAKAERYRHASDKLEVSGLSFEPSEIVAPPRVRECKLQFEASVRRATPGLGEYLMVEAEVVRVHAAPEIVVPGTDHVDPNAWHPTIYSFRHYFDIGAEVGWRSTSDTASG